MDYKEVRRFLKIANRTEEWLKENNSTLEKEYEIIQEKKSKMPSVLRSYVEFLMSKQEEE